MRGTENTSVAVIINVPAVRHGAPARAFSASRDSLFPVRKAGLVVFAFPTHNVLHKIGAAI